MKLEALAGYIFNVLVVCSQSFWLDAFPEFTQLKYASKLFTWRGHYKFANFISNSIGSARITLSV